jgi:hypothetical protein
MTTERTTIKAGDDLVLSKTWLDAEGEPLDLTGYTMTGKLRRKGDTSTNVVATLDVTPDADQTTNPGVYAIELDDAETADLPIAILEYDIRAESAGGVVSTSETFEMLVKLAVSR